MKGSWYLDGVYLAPYEQLKEKTIDKLKFVGNINGVSIFEDPTITGGTLELRYGGRTLVIVRGTGKEN